MSHNISYVSSALSTSNVSGDISAMQALGANTFGDIFKEHNMQSQSLTTCGKQCYIKCSCNNDNGWFASSAGMGGSYVKATTKRRYAITELGTFSANTFASLSTSTGSAAGTSGINTSSMTGTSGFNTSSVYPGINTSGMVAIPINTEQQTCYKAKGCPSGYFEEKPDDTYFNYTTSEGCYKVTGCKSPYLSSYENAEEVANYEPQDYHCYLPIYYIDVTYDLNLSSRNAEVRCQLSDGYKGAVFEITGKYEGKHINGTIRCDSTVQNVNSSWVIEGNEHITDMFEAARYEFSQGSGHMGGCVDFKKENGYFCEGNNYTFWKLRIRREMWSSDGSCPNGYFEDMPNGTYFDYTTSQNCYKVTGCKSPYVKDGASGITYHGFTCGLNTYYIDINMTTECNDPYSSTCTIYQSCAIENSRGEGGTLEFECDTLGGDNVQGGGIRCDGKYKEVGSFSRNSGFNETYCLEHGQYYFSTGGWTGVSGYCHWELPEPWNASGLGLSDVCSTNTGRYKLRINGSTSIIGSGTGNGNGNTDIDHDDQCACWSWSGHTTYVESSVKGGGMCCKNYDETDSCEDLCYGT